jgi:hypothetical protein
MAGGKNTEDDSRKAGTKKLGKDPRFLVLTWVVCFITGFAIYSLLRYDIPGAVASALLVATVVTLINWRFR